MGVAVMTKWKMSEKDKYAKKRQNLGCYIGILCVRIKQELRKENGGIKKKVGGNTYELQGRAVYTKCR
jgi:hypothetical protein